jgi:CubicO group peptidase (beta-lactamase class C family)
MPKDLSAVTRYDPAQETTPNEVGLTQDSVDAIWNKVTDLYQTGIHPAISFVLRRHGKVVLKRSIGHTKGNGPSDSPLAEKIVASPDTPYCTYSASKAVTAMLIHLLVERHKIRLGDYVSDHIPEFGVHGKHTITIHDLLSHRAGFPAMPKEVDWDTLLNFDACLRFIFDSKPKYPVGERIAYHTLTSGYVLGEIVRRITGKDIREFLRETIQEPLGFKYFNFGVRDECIPDVAVNYVTGVPIPRFLSSLTKQATGLDWHSYVAITNDEKFLRAIVPSGNLIATADEMSRFYQMLLNGGELDGKRIFKPETVRQAIISASETMLDGTTYLPVRYSEGFMLGSKSFSLYLPYYKEAFGHWGFVGIFCWADRTRDIVVSLMNSGKAFLGLYVLTHFRLVGLIKRNCPKVTEGFQSPA